MQIEIYVNFTLLQIIICSSFLAYIYNNQT